LIGVLVFWWILLFLVQSAERVFLLREAARVEPPTVALLAHTLLTGARADLILATLGTGLAVAGAAVVAAPVALAGPRAGVVAWFRRSLRGWCWTLAVAFLLVLTVDMGYYGYNRQHLDTVFFEYVDDMLSRAPASTRDAPPATGSRQAMAQTRAELGDAGKWAARLAMFGLLQALVIAGWRWLYRRGVEAGLARWRARAPMASGVVLGVCVVAGASGLHWQGPLAIARVGISSTTYYALAQSPIWQTGEGVFLALRAHGTRARAEGLMPLPDAIRVARRTIAPAAAFASDEYPLVHRTMPAPSAAPRRLNVFVIFVEGLDRRFIGPRVTPFLDGWGRDAIVFEHFFSNGTLTHHGLFASLCSHLSGFGKSPIKVRYTNDYLCLPEVLRRAGYATEMVIGYNRDHHQDHTALFLARNGVRRFLDEGNFPATAERLGLGLTDGALFDQLRDRLRALRQGGAPFFLATLTLTMHHPFLVPLRDADVAALAREPDRYVATLRYTDRELERFFTTARRAGLLDDTLVLLLGDHGRHEVLGRSPDEPWLGHHLTRLYVWLDPALRPAVGFRPRVVQTVASQIDLAPTILGVTGLAPRLAPFMGTDLSCVIVADCRPEHEAALLTNHSVALVGGSRIFAYGLRSGQLREMDLALGHPRDIATPTPADAAAIERLKALVVTSTLLVEQNRVWSWAKFGDTLGPVAGRAQP
jgi:phosphoglycerol transferase MdoB-like AlkP superfamily enzyme